jgi:hypothetical protein
LLFREILVTAHRVTREKVFVYSWPFSHSLQRPRWDSNPQPSD